MSKALVKRLPELILLLLISIVFCPFHSSAQYRKYSPQGWQLMDWKKDSIFGTSVNKAYDELLKGKKSKTVIVAVIDGGVDTAHEDLQGHIWTNTREIPGNGIDDDHNGYVDDVHGWNFLGGKDGRSINSESYESYREYYRLRPIYSSVQDSTTIEPRNRKDFGYWLKLKIEHDKDSIKLAQNVDMISHNVTQLIAYDSILRHVVHKDSLYQKDILAIEDSSAANAKEAALRYFKKYDVEPDLSFENFIEQVKDFLEETKAKLQSVIADPNAIRRDIVGDDPDNINDRNYGNNNIAAGTPSHGTHVSGIITATRGNGIGMDGIADNVLIMALRAVPDGDERDKDVALAIRYAVDNGARIINMSFGKYYSPGKKWVDDAVRYAAQKDVLLVHAAGNEARNLDNESDFPNPDFENTNMKAVNWITVGASAGGPDSLLVANFSNYGKKEVDLFAPGVNIYSTVPGNQYEGYSGTSMATPVVVGIAALVMEYYPSLSARQVKYVLENSVLKLSGYKVRIPGGKGKADFSALSKSQGLINAYSALKLASTMKGEHKIKKVSPIKSKLE